MIDTLELNRGIAAQLNVENIIQENRLPGSNSGHHELSDLEYAVMTLHRPSNVDDPEVFLPMMAVDK